MPAMQARSWPRISAVEIDRQAIERRDFPIARRGYDPAAVDAHLRALAAEVEELGRSRGEEPSLATSASSQVQSILAAAETAAADIEREAQQRATSVRSEADSDARRTREEAIAKARAHLAAVAQATETLLQRVASIDGELGALLESLRGSAGRLASDLAALDGNIGVLYDAASGQSPAESASARETVPATSPGGQSHTGRSRGAAASASRATAVPAERQGPAQVPSPEKSETPADASGAGDNGDVDGARLVALNMALSGEPRDVTERYLAEHFQLSARQALIDEVYAAIEA
jgi:DivIVA domain-containing protein